MFTADNHLRRNVWAQRPALAGDTFYSLGQVVSYCIAEHLNLVIGGDTYDTTKPPSEAVLFFKYQADRMTEAGLTIYAIDGNHDGDDPSWLDLMSGSVVNVNNKSFEPVDRQGDPGPFRAYGLPYQRGELLQEALAGISPDVNMLVCHQLIDWAFPKEGAYNMKAEWVPPHIRFVALGDFHKAVDWYDADRDILHAYPGSTALQSISEPPEKSFMVVGIDKETGRVAFERVPLLTRPVLTAMVVNEQQIGELQSAVDEFVADPRLLQLPEELRRPILRVTYEATIPAAIERLRSIVGNRAELWPEPLNIAALSPSETATAPRHVTIEGVLGTVVDPVKDEPLFRLVYDLLTQPDPAKVLDGVRQALGV